MKKYEMPELEICDIITEQITDGEDDGNGGVKSGNNNVPTLP